MHSLNQVLEEGRARSVLLGNALSVIAPIKSKNIVGAALVRIPTARMWQAVQNQLKTALLIALAVLGTGFVLSLLLQNTRSRLSKRLLQPLHWWKSASSIRPRSPLLPRSDELGRLARVFSRMGQTVLAREEKLTRSYRNGRKRLSNARSSSRRSRRSCPNI